MWILNILVFQILLFVILLYYSYSYHFKIYSTTVSIIYLSFLLYLKYIFLLLYF